MRLRVSPRAWTFAAVGVAGLAWAALLAAAHLEGRPTPLDRVEYLTLDARALLVGPRPAPSGVAIVAIDDETIQAVGQYPLPRAVLARLVDAIAGGDARVVALDMLFTNATTPEADTALADALGRTRAVVAAAATFGRDGITAVPDESLPGLPAAERVLGPIEPVRSSAGAGLVNVSTDEGGTPRYVPLLVRVGSSVVPALTLAAASLFVGEAPSFERDAVLFGASRIPLDLGRHLALRFYGPRGSVPTLSAGDILKGGDLGGRLRGKAVVVGVTATGAGDVFATPFDPVLPGVEVTATALAELVGPDALVRTSSVRRVDCGIAVGLTIALVVLLGLTQVGAGLGVGAGLVAAWLGAVTWAFAHGYWMSVCVPLAAALPAGGAAFLARFYLDRVASAASSRSALALRPFQQPALAERLIRDPDFLVRPEERQVAIVFIDLSGFTGLSESVGPQRARDLLETFHGLVEESATAHEGVVASYQGDGAMILFGLLDTRGDDAARALAMSLALRDVTKGWLRDLEGDLAPLDVKLGAHLGRVSLSRLGHRTHQHITAIGDAVNVASRLMGVAAQHGASLAASCDLLRHAAAFGSVHVDGFGPPLSTAIRGRSRPLDIRLSPGPRRPT